MYSTDISCVFETHSKSERSRPIYPGMKRPPRLLVAALAFLAVLGALVSGAYAAFSAQTSNSGNSFTAASSFPSCNANLLFLNGFEAGTLTLAGGASFFSQQLGSSGTASVDSAVKHNGLYSLAIQKSAGGSMALSGGGAGAGTLDVHFALRLPSLPSSSVMLARFDLNSGLLLNVRYDAPSGKFKLDWTGSGGSVLSSTTVQAGTWQSFDVRISAASAPPRADWQVDGTAQPQLVSTAAATTVNGGLLGSVDATDSFAANYDDVAASAAAADYPLGDGAVLPLSPTSMGASNGATNFRDGTGAAIDANSYTALDDQPLSSTADWLKQVTASTSSYLELGLGDSSRTCIEGVSAIVAYAASGTSGSNGATVIHDGTIDRIVYSGPMNSTSLRYASAIVPPAGAQWTRTELNALTARIGYSSNVGSQPYWHGLLLQYFSR